MTKERAIDLCKAIDIYLCTGNPIWDVEEIHDAMSMAIEALKEQQWIPVKERLPEETGKYLITEEDGEVCVDTYLVKHNEWYKCFPIAWMPLPKPYEGEKE